MDTEFTMHNQMPRILFCQTSMMFLWDEYTLHYLKTIASI